MRDKDSMFDLLTQNEPNKLLGTEAPREEEAERLKQEAATTYEAYVEAFKQSPQDEVSLNSLRRS